jgi:hypothetical protein
MLCFDSDSPKHLDNLVQASRIFEALEFVRCRDDCLSSQVKFEAIEEYISFTGTHIKRLTIGGSDLDQKILQKLLNLLPNLEALELIGVKSVNQEQSIQFVLKSTKIECFELTNCTGFGNFLESLENCAIKELELTDWSNTESDILKKFLKVQEKNLKKLTIEADPNLLNDLMELRLEHFVYRGHIGDSVPLEFLNRQKNLKFLQLCIWNFSNELFEMIWELKNLETLELDGSVSDRNSLNDIHKLQKLKRLKISNGMSSNILEHLQFGVCNDLEELNAFFSGASLDSTREMKRITPNLKEIEIHCNSLDTFDELLETLENLESVTILNGSAWEIPSEKFYPKMKYLDVNLNFISFQFPFAFSVNFSAEQFAKTFPNLETFKINRCSLKVTESSQFFVTLLSELKELKTFHMQIWADLELDRESALQCFQRYGKHLKDVQVCFYFPESEHARPSFAIEKRPEAYSATSSQVRKAIFKLKMLIPPIMEKTMASKTKGQNTCACGYRYQTNTNILNVECNKLPKKKSICILI